VTPALDRDLIHVWRLSISTIRSAELLPTLAEDERDRTARFVFEKDRHQFMAVRGWLRRLCGAYLHEAPAAIRFSYGLAGKPALAANGTGIDLRFNVSHSGDVALLAFSLGREIGVDVEYIDDRVDILDLSRACFSAEEQQSLQTSAADQHLEMFFRYWTSKEAYIKALGDGLSMPLQDFTIDVRPDSSAWPIKVAEGRANTFTVQPLPVPAGYLGAVVSEGSDWRVLLCE
jgi:4'-phosphopantetheinyl transferase